MCYGCGHRPSSIVHFDRNSLQPWEIARSVGQVADEKPEKTHDSLGRNLPGEPGKFGRTGTAAFKEKIVE
jgi:hypothetical protein